MKKASVFKPSLHVQYVESTSYLSTFYLCHTCMYCFNLYSGVWFYVVNPLYCFYLFINLSATSEKFIIIYKPVSEIRMLAVLVNL